MKKGVGFLFIFFFTIIFLFSPLVIFAQFENYNVTSQQVAEQAVINNYTQIAQASGGLVPCGRTENLSDQCQFCHLIELIQRVINFIVVYLAAPVATLLFAYAGIKLIVQAGNENARSEAKQLLIDVLVGFLWILLAWTVVIGVLNILVNRDNLSSDSRWFRIQCFSNYAAPEFDFRTFQGGSAAYPVRSQDCSDCRSLGNDFNVKTDGAGACSGGGTCQVSATLITQLNALNTALRNENINWQITEAWPPTVSHQATCHRAGTCIDANFFGGSSATGANIDRFYRAADSAGLRAEYEVATQAQADSIRASLPTGSSAVIRVIPQITAPHFSVYRR